MYFSCFTPGIGINRRRRDHEKYFGLVFVPFPFIFLGFFFFIFSVVSSKVKYLASMLQREVMWWVVKKNIIRFDFFMGIVSFVDIYYMVLIFFFLILSLKFREFSDKVIKSRKDVLCNNFHVNLQFKKRIILNVIVFYCFV